MGEGMAEKGVDVQSKGVLELRGVESLCGAVKSEQLLPPQPPLYTVIHMPSMLPDQHSLHLLNHVIFSLFRTVYMLRD